MGDSGGGPQADRDAPGAASTPPPGPDTTPRAARAFLILCGVGMFAILSSTMSKTPVLPLFAKHLGVTDAVLGFVAAASTVVGILVSLPAGGLSDVLGRRKVLLAALLVFASAPVLYLFVHTAGALVLVRVYHGLATAIFGPVAMAYVADLAKVRRGERMGWYSSATLAGRSVAPMLGGVLILLSYHAVYVACAGAGILAFALGFLLPGQVVEAQAGPEAGGGAGGDAEAPSAEPDAADLSSSAPEPSAFRQMLDSLRDVGRNRIILTTSVVEAMQYFAFGAVETFLPIYAVAQGVTKWQIGLIFGAQIVVLALTKPFSGRASDRLGRRPVIASGLALNAFALVALTVYPRFWGFLVGASLFGLAMSVVTASTSALVADVSREQHYGMSLGALSTVMDCGHASGPIAAGFVVGVLAYAGTYQALAGLMVVAMVVFLVATRRLGGGSASDTSA